MPMKNRIPATVLVLLALATIGACDHNHFDEGQRIYQANCANCHMDDGIGLSALIPPLAGSDFIGPNRERLPCLLRYGLRDTIVVNGRMYGEQMPPMPALSDVQITNVLNYIGHNWGNRVADFHLDEVQGILGKCH